jgi:hypothetical protein
VYSNKKFETSWDRSEEEDEAIRKEVVELFIGRKVDHYFNKVEFLKIYGVKTTPNKLNRKIKPEIKKELFRLNPQCVVCGTGSDLQIDHKNALYNDHVSCSVGQQSVEDFQVLCRHCNDVKRQVSNWQIKNKKRFPATMIPQLAMFGIDYISGDEQWDPKDPNAMVGTYWYDPLKFMTVVKEKLK